MQLVAIASTHVIRAYHSILYKLTAAAATHACALLQLLRADIDVDARAAAEAGLRRNAHETRRHTADLVQEGFFQLGPDVPQVCNCARSRDRELQQNQITTMHMHMHSARLAMHV